MSDLKPCPFCGGEPKYVRDHTTENIDEIICQGCWITVSDHTEQGSCVRAWNRRTKDAEIERLRARIAEMDEAPEWVEQKPAIPLEEGWYLVMHPGDSESVDGYTLYSFGDYEGWAYWTPASPDEFEDFDGGYKGCWTCQHDEDGEFIFAYLGPFKFTPFDQRARKALESNS